MKKYLSLLTFSFAFLLQGCGAGKLTVLDPINDSEKAQSLRIKEGKHTLAVPKESIETFEKKFKEKLYKDTSLTEGDDIQIVYRFIQYNEGSRFARYFLGGIGNAGEGSLTIELVFIKRDGTQIGKIQTEGKIGSGFAGGSMDSAVDSAVDVATDFIKTTFTK
jgi:hypothetical protein